MCLFGGETDAGPSGDCWELGADGAGVWQRGAVEDWGGKAWHTTSLVRTPEVNLLAGRPSVGYQIQGCGDYGFECLAGVRQSLFEGRCRFTGS